MKVKEFAKGMLALAFLVVLAMLGWALFTSMVKVFGEFTSTVEPTIVVAIISGLGAIIVNAISKHSERKSQLLTQTKEKMVPVYEQFLSSFNAADSEEKVQAVFEAYQPQFAVNSSDATYAEFQTIITQYKKDKTKDTVRFVTALRKELKISNKTNKSK